MDRNQNRPEEEFVDLMSGGKPEKPKKKMSTVKKGIISVVVVLLLIAGGLVWYVYSFLNLVNYDPPYSCLLYTSRCV